MFLKQLGNMRPKAPKHATWTPPRRRPHVNLVSGKNGSGKSAIVHALQFCLGASAKQTGRGNALKEFVRNGATSCCVSVTLWNTGAHRFPVFLNTHGVVCPVPL